MPTSSVEPSTRCALASSTPTLGPGRRQQLRQSRQAVHLSLRLGQAANEENNGDAISATVFLLGAAAMAAVVFNRVKATEGAGGAGAGA